MRQRHKLERSPIEWRTFSLVKLHDACSGGNQVATRLSSERASWTSLQESKTHPPGIVAQERRPLARPPQCLHVNSCMLVRSLIGEGVNVTAASPGTNCSPQAGIPGFESARSVPSMSAIDSACQPLTHPLQRLWRSTFSEFFRPRCRPRPKPASFPDICMGSLRHVCVMPGALLTPLRVSHEDPMGEKSVVFVW